MWNLLFLCGSLKQVSLGDSLLVMRLLVGLPLPARGLYLGYDKLGGFSLFLGMWAVWGDVSQWDYCHGFVPIHGEEAFRGGDVEVANPARAESALRGCKAQVLYGNGEVNVAVGLAILLAYPASANVLQAKHVHWGCREPWAVIALAYALFCLG